MTRLFFLLTLCAAAPAAAQEIDCTEAAVQLELNYCAEHNWTEADVRLNAAYNAAMADLEETLADMPDDLKKETEMLRDAQRAWITFRDANCAVAGYPMRGGSAEPLLIYGCLRQMTVERTAELTRMGQF